VKLASKAFEDRVLNDLLPAFCNARGWGLEGFRREWDRIGDRDAEDFLRGLDAGLVEHVGRGLYRAPRSTASEQFFWSGRVNVEPRPVTLWAEPIITVAVLTRLHFDLGWPKHRLGTQSPGWAFDVTAYQPPDLDSEHIACEVKKSPSELEQLVAFMARFGRNQPSDELRGPKLNAYRKVRSLRLRRTPLVWAVGPNKSHVFRMAYNGELVIFKPTSNQELRYLDCN
jgi:hypothetical protein